MSLSCYNYLVYDLTDHYLSSRRRRKPPTKSRAQPSGGDRPLPSPCRPSTSLASSQTNHEQTPTEVQAEARERSTDSCEPSTKAPFTFADGDTWCRSM